MALNYSLIIQLTLVYFELFHSTVPICIKLHYFNLNLVNRFSQICDPN